MTSWRGVRTSQAIAPKEYTSSALAGCVTLAWLGDAPGQVNSAGIGESRSTLVPPSAVHPAEWGRMEALPRPAIRATPSLSTRMLVYGAKKV